MLNILIKYNINKARYIIVIVYFLLLFWLSMEFIKNPEYLIRNDFMKTWHIKALGILGVFICLVVLYTVIRTYFKSLKNNIAIIISKDYLEDNSRYESLGKIYWDEILKIKRIPQTTSLEITLKNEVFKRGNINLIKKIILFILNSKNYNRSIFISSELLDCSIKELEKMLLTAFNNYKKGNVSK